MSVAHTDPKLIRAIRDHANYEAWQTFTIRYTPIIVTYCTARGMPRSSAEEVAQEVFLRICTYGFADRYDPDQGSFRFYLYRVARSVASRMATAETAGDFGEPWSEDPDDAWRQRWREQAVRLALHRVETRISERARQILSLSLRGVSPRVIADLTGMTRDAVYKVRERTRLDIESACRELMLETNEI